MKKLIASGSIALLIALFAVIFTGGVASAHGHRMVGPYSFTVGFLDEPVFANQKSGLDLTICKGDCQYTVKDGTRVITNPVADADKTLKADVTMGASAPLPLTLKPVYNQPGKYAGYFTPSKAGDYTFHITGTLEGTAIDEKFASTRDGFGAVEENNLYPAVSGNEQGTDVTALENQVNDLQNTANTATTVGIIGIVAGILGLALAAFALTRKPHAALVGSKEPASIDSLRG